MGAGPSVLGVCAWATASLALAAAPPKAPDGPSARAMLAQRIEQVEGELAARMLKRPTTTGDALTRLELQIDLRLFARWALTVSANAPSGSDAQAAAWLRAGMFLDAADAIEGVMGHGGATTWSKPQTEIASQLHQISYSLAQRESLKDMDQISQKMAAAVVFFAGTNIVDPTSLPPMRPRRPATSRPAGDERIDGAQVAAQLADEVAKLPMGDAVRTQAQQLAKLLLMTSRQAGQEKEAAALRSTLEQAVGLGRALGRPSADWGDLRPALEARLADGLALYLDPRTRIAGQSKIDALHVHRRIAERFSRMELSPTYRAQLAPLLGWAQANPEAGAKALAALDRFVQARSAMDARSRQPASPPAIKKSAEEVEKQFEQATASFLAAAADLAKPTSALTIADLEKAADEMQRTGRILALLDQSPRTQDTLIGFKPRPFGGLEKRIANAVAAIGPGATPAKAAEATRLLEDLTRLAGIASDLSLVRLSEVPADVDKVYAGGQLAALEAKWKGMVTELVSAVANGAEVDRAKLSRLAGLGSLLQAILESQAAEAALANYGVLSRWCDWRINPADLQSMLAPWAQLTSEAVLGFNGDSPGALDKFARSALKYRPLAVLIRQVGQYRQQCDSLPTGIRGLAASLLTPMEQAPFAAERLVSFAAALRARCIAATDPAGADEVVTWLNWRLARELRME